MPKQLSKPLVELQMQLEITLEKKKKKLNDHLTDNQNTHRTREFSTTCIDLLLSNEIILSYSFYNINFS